MKDKNLAWSEQIHNRQLRQLQKLVREQKNQEQTKTANCKFYFYSDKKVEEYYNSKKALRNEFWLETS